MDFWEKYCMAIAITVVVVIILASLVAFTPVGRAIWNFWDYQTQKVDDTTNYETRKKVEDTCRATIVSYETDKLTWMQYKDSQNAEQRSWADAAKMRANKAAITYNEYFLKNSYVFNGNIPSDIRTELDILE